MKKYLILIVLFFVSSCVTNQVKEESWYQGSWVADIDKTKPVYGDKASGALASYQNKTISVNHKDIIITAIHPEIIVSNYFLSSSKDNLVILNSEVGDYQFGKDIKGVYTLTKVIPLKTANVSGSTTIGQLLDTIRNSEEDDPVYYKVYMKRI